MSRDATAGAASSGLAQRAAAKRRSRRPRIASTSTNCPVVSATARPVTRPCRAVATSCDLVERDDALTSPGRLSMKVVLHTMRPRFGEAEPHLRARRPGTRRPRRACATRRTPARRARAEPSANVERMLAAAAARGSSPARGEIRRSSGSSPGSCSTMRPPRLPALEDRARPEPAAAAHRDQRALRSERSSSCSAVVIEPGTGRADGVAQARSRRR